ncbi:hypothetical protein [Xylanivirga thermophila]|uniref:hypothetical protein n=1 Tax=Xylanivirga thermophila TaxID=2496273 RepID=UPI00101B7BA5|nr:hypothetical protein [Xylanivirga thermophila]
MQGAKIVFAVFIILSLMPIITAYVKRINKSAKENDKKAFYTRIIAMVLICGIIMAFFISLYRFTIDYQAPLFVERCSDVIIEERDNEISKVVDILKCKDLVSSSFIPMDEAILSNFPDVDDYKLSLSSKMYDTEDARAIYAMYEWKNKKAYMEFELDMEKNTWRLVSISSCTDEKIEEIDSNMKFSKIKS